jgi:hypothetical protein
MIKLESKNQMPSAVAALELKSSGDTASISLATEEIREQVNGEWVTSTTKRKQIVTFIGNDGTPCMLEGIVAEAEVVEVGAAWKIVLQVTVVNELKAAFQAGRKSQAYTALGVTRVVEVWDTPRNCLWKAATGISRASGSVAEMDDSGKIVRKAA